MRRQIHLTEHFIERWAQRVCGAPPTPGLILNLICGAVVLQKSARTQDNDGCPYITLSLYWVPEADLVIKLDETEWPPRAVTVLTPELSAERRSRHRRKKL
jgi:hypothetical protein